uniref:Sulfotransferase domain-containing protein n=1 Tax=Chrysotila carterae TaxID=13221 RepID=A0A7S4B6D4_CHRCT
MRELLDATFVRKSLICVLCFLVLLCCIGPSAVVGLHSSFRTPRCPANGQISDQLFDVSNISAFEVDTTRPYAGTASYQLRKENTQSLPVALVMISPHKTGSTFFVGFLRAVTLRLDSCFYSENAQFTHSPKDFSKCSSPGCGHEGPERRQTAKDTGWGECTTFISGHLKSLASACPQLSASTCSARFRRGFVWGPVRLLPAMRATISLGRSHAHHWQFYYILHQRHPLDTTVSAYHSFGWSHPPAPNSTKEQLREYQVRRANIRNQTADQYALSSSDLYVSKYLLYFELLESPPPGAVLIRSRYEEMVLFFSQWLNQILAPFELSFNRMQREALQRTLRKKYSEAFSPNGAHKRTITPGAFTRELQPETISLLTERHRDTLIRLGYL